MSNPYFQFKQFLINQEHSGMKVTTDGCLFGAWVASRFGRHNLKRVLDIGTGTGLLTLMLAQKIDSTFDAVEVDEKAHKESDENFKLSPWAERIFSFQMKIQEFNTPNRYDLIVCNPPFFKENQLGNSVRKNRAVHDNMLPMKDLIDSADRLLKPEGKLAIMYPEWEMSRFVEQADTSGFLPTYTLKVFNKPGGNVFRVISIFSRLAEEQLLENFIIRDGSRYTPQFQKVIEDYYL